MAQSDTNPELISSPSDARLRNFRQPTGACRRAQFFVRGSTRSICILAGVLEPTLTWNDKSVTHRPLDRNTCEVRLHAKTEGSQHLVSERAQSHGGPSRILLAEKCTHRSDQPGSCRRGPRCGSPLENS